MRDTRGIIALHLEGLKHTRYGDIETIEEYLEMLLDVKVDLEEIIFPEAMDYTLITNVTVDEEEVEIHIHYLEDRDSNLFVTDIGYIFD